jgi:uncharacterized protein (DUF2267 family)
MDYQQFLADVQLRAGFAGPSEAERAIAVTARVLGQRLLSSECVAVAGALPAPVAGRLLRTAYERDFDLDELYDRVARGEGIQPGFGREHAQAVCQAIGTALPHEVRLRLQRHLPAEMAFLFEPHDAGAPPPRPARADPAVEPGAGTTLATGRPGSRHPLSEGRADRAHQGSVARSDDPHADTKLSSARGLTQERLGESLASGQPGPAHPVSQTRR